MAKSNGNGAQQKTQAQSQKDYYHQMAQAYGMTDDQFNEVIGQTPAGQAPKNYGQPTDSFTPERQLSPGGQWKDIDPRTNQDFRSLQQLNQVGLLPQQAAPPPQPGSTLADMWNAYMSQGRGQAQPASAATVAMPVQNPIAQPRATIPIATIPPIQNQQFAPPAPPAPGQGQQWQGPQQQWQLPQYARGGVAQGPAVVGERGREIIIPSGPTQVIPLNDQRSRQAAAQLPHMAQGGTVYPYNQGQAPGNVISNLYPLYGMSAMGAAALGGAPMVINPTPQAPTPGNYPPGNPYGGGVYTGPQLPTVYGTQQSSAPQAVASSLGQYTLPGGGQLTQEQMARFMAGTPDQQQQVATALGTTPGAILQAAYGGGGSQGGQMAYGGGSAGGGGAQGSWELNRQPQFVSPTGNMPAGPWNVTAGLFAANPYPTSTAAQSTIQPTLPANAAAARPGGTGVPWATASGPGRVMIPPSSIPAPSAPGAGAGAGMWPVIAAHNSGLANAGKALYAHFGGDPDTATPEDISNFRQHIGSLSAGVQGDTALKTAATNYTAGAATSKQQPVKMQYGGPVPGDPNAPKDSVNIKGTPGEYMLTKEQVKRLSEIPAAMQVIAQTPAQGATDSGQSATTTQASSPAAAASGSGQIDWNALAQARASRQALNSGGASGGGYNAPGIGYIGASPGPGQSGYAYPSQAAATAAGDVGTGMGGGAGGKVGSAIGTLADGLAKAAKTYADSVGSWIPQKQAFASSAPTYKPVTFQQEEVA